MRCLFALLIAFKLIGLNDLHAQVHLDSIAVVTRSLPDHPRILLFKGEEKILMQNIQKYPQWQAVHMLIIDECDKIILAPPVQPVKIGRRLLDKSRECLRRVFMLSYAYRTTTESKYLARAEKEMLAAADFEDWNPSHFLDVAEMTLALAIGYDWLYDDLSEETLDRVGSAIIEKGIRPSMDRNYNWFLSADQNWNQVCNSGMTIGALAIAERDSALAEVIIKRSIASVPKAMRAYAPDGAYPEGFSYWDYGTSFNVLMISSLEKALKSDFGISKSPGFLQTGTFIQHMVGPTGLAHNWGDSGPRESLTPVLFWFAKKNSDPALLWSQKKRLSHINKSETKNRILPALLVWGTQTDLNSVHPPDNKLWVGHGLSPVALMRTSWERSDAVFLGVKAGSPSVNHAHMDVGSFVVDAIGERWAMDFGMQDYNSLESKGVKLWDRSQNSQRWQVFRLNNLAHNIISFDGQLNNVKGYADIQNITKEGNDMKVKMDLSELYVHQVKTIKRAFGVIDRRYVVIRDEIECGDTARTMRWNMLTSAKVRIIDERTVELSKNGKKMFLIVQTRTPVTLKTWTTTPSNDYDAPNPGTVFIGFEAKLPNNTSHSFNTYLTPSPDVHAVQPLLDWHKK